MKIFNKTLDKINGIVYNILVKRLRETGLAPDTSTVEKVRLCGSSTAYGARAFSPWSVSGSKVTKASPFNSE